MSGKLKAYLSVRRLIQAAWGGTKWIAWPTCNSKCVVHNIIWWSICNCECITQKTYDGQHRSSYTRRYWGRREWANTICKRRAQAIKRQIQGVSGVIRSRPLAIACRASKLLFLEDRLLEHDIVTAAGCPMGRDGRGVLRRKIEAYTWKPAKVTSNVNKLFQLWENTRTVVSRQFMNDFTVHWPVVIIKAASYQSSIGE